MIGEQKGCSNSKILDHNRNIHVHVIGRQGLSSVTHCLATQFSELFATRRTAGPLDGIQVAIFGQTCILGMLPAIASAAYPCWHRARRTHETEHGLPSSLKIAHQAISTINGVKMTFRRVAGSAPEILELNVAASLTCRSRGLHGRSVRDFSDQQAEKNARLERLELTFAL